MSALKPIDECVTCQRVASPNVLQYANDKRNNGSFNDVTIEAGDQTIAANRLILSCCSRFFEAMFDLELKEKYQNPVQIHGVDGAAVKSVIDFMYSGEVKITSKNVIELIAASDYLQVDEVKRFCFEFLESILSSDNWFVVLGAAKLYESEYLLRHVYEYVSNNFDGMVQTDEFKTLPKNDLISLISKINTKQTNKKSIFNGIVTWCRYDEEARKEEFPMLFEDLINLDTISAEFLEDIVLKEEMVSGSIHCLKRMTYKLFQEKKCREETKIISLGGTKSLRSCIEVFSCSNKPSKNLPELPIELSCHCSLKLGNYVYLIGGITTSNDCENEKVLQTVWRLDTNDKMPTWKKIVCLKVKRFLMGSAVFRDTLVVVGGHDGNSILNSVEFYVAALDEWKAGSPLPERRGAFSMAANEEHLYAIGGLINNKISAKVQRTSNLQTNWEEIAPMQMPRRWFAAVICNGIIYAIGGQTNSEHDVTTNTVEKYDFVEEKWVYVNSMITKRSAHAACVMNGKIYVVGGLDASNTLVNSIECYDPTGDSWSVVACTDIYLYNHSLIVL